MVVIAVDVIGLAVPVAIVPIFPTGVVLLAPTNRDMIPIMPTEPEAATLEPIHQHTLDKTHHNKWNIRRYN